MARRLRAFRSARPSFSSFRLRSSGRRSSAKRTFSRVSTCTTRAVVDQHLDRAVAQRRARPRRTARSQALVRSISLYLRINRHSMTLRPAPRLRRARLRPGRVRLRSTRSCEARVVEDGGGGVAHVQEQVEEARVARLGLDAVGELDRVAERGQRAVDRCARPRPSGSPRAAAAAGSRLPGRAGCRRCRAFLSVTRIPSRNFSGICSSSAISWIFTSPRS